MTMAPKPVQIDGDKLHAEVRKRGNSYAAAFCLLVNHPMSGALNGWQDAGQSGLPENSNESA